MAVIIKNRKYYYLIYTTTDPNGKTIQHKESFSTYKEAEARSEMIEHIDKGRILATKDSYISDFVFRYITEIGLYVWTDSGYNGYLSIFNNYVKVTLGMDRVKDINDTYAKEFFIQLKTLPSIAINRTTRTKELSDSVILKANSLMNSCCDYLVDHDLIKNNPFKTNETGIEKPRKIKNIEWNILYFEKLCKYLPTPQMMVHIHLLFSTGFNSRDILALSWDDIKTSGNETKIISVNTLTRSKVDYLKQNPNINIIETYNKMSKSKQLTKLVLVKKETKDVAVLPSRVVELLVLWKDEQKLLIPRGSNKRKLILTNDFGMPYEERLMEKLFLYARDKAKLPPVSLRGLKDFSQRRNEDHQRISDIYYSELTKALELYPQVISKKNHIPRGIKENFQKKLEKSIPKKEEPDNHDAEDFIDSIRNDPELRDAIINYILGKEKE